LYHNENKPTNLSVSACALVAFTATAAFPLAGAAAAALLTTEKSDFPDLNETDDVAIDVLALLDPTTHNNAAAIKIIFIFENDYISYTILFQNQ
jgi:hypothetical protein